MNLNYLKDNAGWFVREVRKHYPEDERPVKHYVTEKEVVILSTKKLYVYYYDNVIRVVDDYLKDLDIKYVKDTNVTTQVENVFFELNFSSIDEMNQFIQYFNKYRD